MLLRTSALAAVLLASGTAFAGIDDLGGTQPGDLAFPAFADADACLACHGGGVAGDTTLLPADTWAGTMMANAARDPVFFAALTIAEQDAPGVGTFCLRCHSPIGFVRGHATPPDGSAFDAVDRQGIGCETCHRARTSAVPNDPYFLGDAQLVYDEDATYGGPRADALSPAHATAADASLGEPRFCGQCHQVTNPEVHLRDATGTDTGLPFPLDTTFTEWARSAFADGLSSNYRSCADCHMPKAAAATPSSSVPGAPLRDGVRGHAATGGNHWGIEAVKAKHPERYAAHAAAFDLAQQRTLETLASAVSVTLAGAPATLAPGASFPVTVRVTNLSGHKFPTGYAESRRAWIAVVLVDGEGNERALLGGYDDATGEVQASPPTHVYRAQHGRWDGQQAVPEEHLARHDVIVSDTRIPPLGFQADSTTMPTAEIDYGDGQGGHRSYDEVTFTLTAPADAMGEQTLEARVYYQSMTREHIAFLKDANVTDDRGAELESIYEKTGRAAPLAIAKATATVTFPGGTSSSSSGSGAAAARRRRLRRAARAAAAAPRATAVAVAARPRMDPPARRVRSRHSRWPQWRCDVAAEHAAAAAKVRAYGAMPRRLVLASASRWRVAVIAVFV
ncbi:cytochrome c family protein [Minicystis rosea]|nr:cytochrome c family protein [Minicystis rosea]